MAKIKSYVQPRRLYRYRSLANIDRELESIVQSYIYCSPFSSLNDPMEGLFTSSNVLKESDNHRVIRNAIRHNKSRLGIASFSEVYDHELMWAHYANQFAGICVSYSLSRLLKAFSNKVEFVRMYYDETVPTVHRSKRDPENLAKMILSYKNYKWLYEREWRMFADQGKVEYDDIKSVTKVYFGSRISDAHVEKARTALEKAGITVSQMKIDEYLIDFEDPD